MPSQMYQPQQYGDSPSPFSGLGGLVGGAISGVANLFGAKKRREQAEKNIRMQQEWASNEAAKERADALRMWKMSNAYNTPTEQMARLEAAGLNPNMVYGSGNAAGITSKPSQSYKRAQTPDFMAMPPPAIAELSDALKAYQDYRMSNAQMQNTRVDLWYKDYARAWEGAHQVAGAQKATAEATSASSKAKMDYFLGKRAEEIAKYTTEGKKANLDMVRSKTRGQNLENDLNALLKPYGITTRDDLLMRQIIRVLSKENPDMGASDLLLLLPALLPGFGKGAAAVKGLRGASKGAKAARAVQKSSKILKLK